MLPWAARFNKVGIKTAKSKVAEWVWIGGVNFNNNIRSSLFYFYQWYMYMSTGQPIETILQGLSRPATDAMDVVQQLAPVINDYINHDFDKLVQLLYRVDVDERKVKQALQLNSGSDAGLILARLVVERHLQKLKAKQMFNTDEPPSEEERW